MKSMNEVRNVLLFFVIPLLLCGCIAPTSPTMPTANQADLDAAKTQLADNIKAMGGAIIDALPVPIPKDETKELLGLIANLTIVGGAAGGAGVLAKKKLGGKKAG